MKLLREHPSTSEDEHFRIMLVQTELERVMFVIRSYVRTRMSKVRTRAMYNSAAIHTRQIEKYARYICMTLEVHEKLSQLELDHAQR